MEGKCLFSIPKVGITGRHIIILEFAKVGVMVIAFPIILVPSVVITSLSNPLIRLELRLSLFFGVVVSIEPNALGLIIAPAELFALEYVSHGIHTFTNDSRLGYCSTLPFSSFVFSAYPTNCLLFRCPDVPTASIPVVAKLMHLTAGSAFYFGQKDAQQLLLIRRMVRDLDFPGRVIEEHRKRGWVWVSRHAIWKEPLAVRNRTMQKNLAHKKQKLIKNLQAQSNILEIHVSHKLHHII